MQHFHETGKTVDVKTNNYITENSNKINLPCDTKLYNMVQRTFLHKEVLQLIYTQK